MWSLGVLFSIISLRFFIRAHVGDDIFGFLLFLGLFCYAQCNAKMVGIKRTGNKTALLETLRIMK